jgi:hypothetical protein
VKDPSTPDHTVGHEHGNRYAARTRPSVAFRRSSGSSAAEPSRKPRDAADLLAKIDALYQELTLQPLPAARKAPSSARPRFAPTGLAFIGALIVVLLAGEVWLYLDRKPPAHSPAQTAYPLEAAVEPPAVPAPAISHDASPIAGAPTPIFENVQKAREVARHKVERQRRIAALEAERRAAAEQQARLEQARRTEVAAAQVAPPPRPASPTELCANSGNFFSRNFCEARACQQAEWANHPDCVRRREEQFRGLSTPNGG